MLALYEAVTHPTLLVLGIVGEPSRNLPVPGYCGLQFHWPVDNRDLLTLHSWQSSVIRVDSGSLDCVDLVG